MWPVFGRCLNLQISRELKQYHDVEALDDVRVIRDRQTSESTFRYYAVMVKCSCRIHRGLPRVWVSQICDVREVKGICGAQLSNNLPLWQ